MAPGTVEMGGGGIAVSIPLITSILNSQISPSKPSTCNQYSLPGTTVAVSVSGEDQPPAIPALQATAKLGLQPV